MRLARVAPAVAAGVLGVASVAGAAGSPAGGSKAIRAHGIVTALALGGSHVAFSNGPTIVVWNVRTGTTAKVGTQLDHGSTELAIAGSRVAWINHTGGNLEGDDYLYASPLNSPKAQQVAKAVRSGAQCGAGRGGYRPACAGLWLGGVVGSGNRILVNRWRTDTTGAVGKAGLYVLDGKRFRGLATGAEAVEAVAADAARVAVLQWRWHPPGNTVRIYSSAGRHVSDAKPKGQIGIALSGRNLVALKKEGYLVLFDGDNGSLRRTFDLHAKELAKDKRPYGNPRWLQALAVQGNIAVYSKPVRFDRGGDPRVSAIHALNLSTGKDRVVGQSSGQIVLARMNSVGLVYATSAEGYAPNRVVFVPFARVAALVS